MDFIHKKNDEINFYELLFIIMKHKLIIILITIFTTTLSLAYLWKTPSVYQGRVLMEIGDVIINSESSNDKPTIIQTIDTTNNLQAILAADPSKNDIKIEMPAGSSNLIRLTYEHNNKDYIRQNLQETIAFILKRHHTKVTFFQKANALIRPTQIISNITISEEAIQPNRNSIISSGLLSGLVIGVFISFFLEFVIFRNSKEKLTSNISESK